MGIDTVLNKILINYIQPHTEIIHHDHIAFIPEMQCWFYIHKYKSVT